MIHNKKVAVIDMGTNTFHLVVGQVQPGGFNILRRHRNPVKLGEGGISQGTISPAAMERAIDALKAFRKEIDEDRINTVVAVATSAVRNADNRSEFLSRAKCEAGIDVQVISGEDEACLIYQGVRQGVQLGKQPNLIMDIGGGSVEFIIGNADRTFWKKSFEIGAQRLLDRFHAGDKITEAEINNLRYYLGVHLAALKKAIQKFHPKRLVGCSGSFDTYVAIMHARLGTQRPDERQPEVLPMDQMAAIRAEILPKGHKERAAIPGMIPLRVDMIVVASLLIEYIVELSQVEEVLVSPYALKEGALSEACCRYERRWVA